jgi:hypothetical protein
MTSTPIMCCFSEATTCFVLFFGGGYFVGQAYRKLVWHVKRAPKDHLGSLDFWGLGLQIQSRLVGVVWFSGIEIGPLLYPFYSQVPISLQWWQRIGSFAPLCRELLFERHCFGSHIYYPLCGYSTCTHWCYKLSKMSLVSMAPPSTYWW